MSGEDETPGLAQQFREHFGHRAHLYGVMLADLADDLDAGGITARICRGHERSTRADVIQLRLLAGIFRIVLRGQAPGLERYYPSLGGGSDPANVWQELEPVLHRYADELHDALSHPPQTNEVGRSACLAIGLFGAVRETGLHRVRLLELGASGGLNLNVDRYRFFGPDWSWGPSDSLLSLDTGAVGVRPEEVTVTSRSGCDLRPVDASSPEGARYLTSFVWPFTLDRHSRLAAALRIMGAHPVRVDNAAASVWLAEQLAAEPPADVLTVVWQSITRQYWPVEETRRVEEIVAAARGRMPLAHVTMEGVPPMQTPQGYDVAACGPELSVDGVVVAHSHHHGLPIVLENI